MKNTGKTSSQGTLYMASNHIGCPADIPSRALEILRSADLVIFEEDKPARQTLKAAGIHRDYFKFNEHHQEVTTDELRVCLAAGKTAVYMSDQGSPSLADPGRHLNKIAFDVGARVSVIPGPSSITAALSATPFESETFKYLGFPPRDPQERKDFLSKQISSGDTLVVLDTPYRMTSIIKELAESHPNKKALMAIDISGDNESFLYGTFKTLKQTVPQEKLNFVMVIEGTEKSVVSPTCSNKKRRR